MLEKAQGNINTPYFPFCNSIVLRPLNNEKYTVIQGKKAFSKSSQKKLKLLKNRVNSQKSISISTSRKIRPLKVLLQNKQGAKRENNSLCSIQTFKQKIDLQKKLTDSAKIQKIIPTQRLQTKNKINYEQINSNRFGIELQGQKSYYKVNLNNTFQSTSFGINQGAIHFQSLAPSFTNSTVYQGVNAANLRAAQSIEKIMDRSTDKDKYNSTYHFRNSCFINTKVDQIYTPEKERYTTEKKISTENTKREKLTLNMARKVQTFETLRTQYSEIDDSAYKLFFSKPLAGEMSNKTTQLP